LIWHMADIATFDLNGVSLTNVTSHAEKAEELVRVLSEVGFVYVINHSISDQEVRAI